MYCYQTQLTSLDISKNTALTDLSCTRNQLTSLDVSKNVVLKLLECPNNQLTNTALNNLFGTLHSNDNIYTYWDYIPGKYIVIRDNPGINDCNRGIAESKGWTIKD